MLVYAGIFLGGFIIGAVTLGFACYDDGCKVGKELACKWLSNEAKHCKRVAKEGFCKEDNLIQAQMIYNYIEHIKNDIQR